MEYKIIKQKSISLNSFLKRGIFVNNSGFTLIEILVVVGVVMIIMLSLSGIMSGVFSSQDKNKASNKIDQNGNWILSELKKNILNADSKSENGLKFNCSVGVGSSIEITSVKDGEKTLITCLGSGDDFKIASISAAIGTTVYLFEKNKDLQLDNCNSFISCSTLPSLELSNVSFNFNLKAGNNILSGGTSRAFSMDVTLRN